MPIKDSARKALRQAKKRTAKNTATKDHIRYLRRQALKAISAKEKKAEDMMKEFSKAVDKASKNNVIKKNTASRLKSRLMIKWSAAMKK